MAKREYTAYVNESGALIYDDPATEEADRLALKGKHLKVIYKPVKSHPSYLQYGYYFGVIVKTVHRKFNELGYRMTMDAVHEMLKAKFHNIQIVLETTGEIITVSDTTTTIPTWEFFDVICEPIREWYHETFGVWIPMPNERMYQEQLAMEASKDK